MDNNDIKHNLSSGEQWLRILYMVMFALVLYVAYFVFWFVVVIQTLFVLISGSKNAEVLKFSGTLSLYIFQCTQFLAYKSEHKPFPFSDWPVEAETVAGESASPVAAEPESDAKSDSEPAEGKPKPKPKRSPRKPKPEAPEGSE